MCCLPGVPIYSVEDWIQERTPVVGLLRQPFEYFIYKTLLPHYFLMLLPLVALFALKQIIHTKNKFAFPTMCIRDSKNSNLLLNNE